MISPFQLPSTVETERTCSHSSPLHTSIISFMYDVHASLVATPENPNPVRDFRRLRVPILVGVLDHFLPDFSSELPSHCS